MHRKRGLPLRGQDARATLNFPLNAAQAYRPRIITDGADISLIRVIREIRG